MGARIAAAVVLLAGCGATLDETPTDASSSDSFRSLDSSSSIDAAIDARVDARLCAGGDARATDPTTGSCLVYFIGPATYAAAETACTAFGSKLAVIKKHLCAFLEAGSGGAQAYAGRPMRDAHRGQLLLGPIASGALRISSALPRAMVRSARAMRRQRRRSVTLIGLHRALARTYVALALATASP